MKKKSIILTIALLLLAGTALRAVPAYPGVIKYRQPDGTYINIQIHGDEFYHYTTSNGRVVAMDKDGFYRPASLPARKSQKTRRSNLSVGKTGGSSSKSPIGMGNKHFIVMLVEFADLEFTVPNANQAFTNLLNQKGYSENGGTGSVKDYYYENSTGQFDPIYDVIGPIKISGGYADYGGNDDDDSDKNPNGALAEACRLASAQGLCDFSNYDHDNDGYVDNIFYFYAGHNEAEGGGADTIWPHAWSVSGVKLNGVNLGSYACTSEYRGASGNNMAGIGTFCHEFGHVIGLPDFYDVDYEKNGSSRDVGAFSLMCNGSYNNNGRTPPYLGALERAMLGWGSITEWKDAGPKNIGPVYQNEGYTTPTTMEGEFFLYEVRDGSGWDRYITTNLSSEPPHGLVVYHVDRSSNKVAGVSAASLWNSNSINKYSVHPCYYVVGPSAGYIGYNDLVYPGTSNITTFEGKDWADVSTGYVLSDINYASSQVTLNLSLPTAKAIVGTVTDSKGNPLQGVKVSVTSAKAAEAPAQNGSRRLVSQKAVEDAAENMCYTGADGKYEVSIPFDAGDDFVVTCSLEMYYTSTSTVTTTGLKTKFDAVLYNISEGVSGELCKHEDASMYCIGFTGNDGPWSGTVAVMFTPDELTTHVGQTLTAINFIINTDSAPEVLDVFVDFDNQRVLTRTVSSFSAGLFNNIDISDAGIVIPSGKKVYIGYAVKNISYKHWIPIDVLMDNGYPGGGMARFGYYTEGGDDWVESGRNFMIDASVKLNLSPFDGLGIKVISNPGNGTYALGSEFSLAFINPSAGEKAESVAWYYDGAPVSGASVTLSAAGKHKVKAIVSYSDGSTEEIVQEIEVK